MYSLKGTQGDRNISVGTKVKLAIKVGDNGLVETQVGVVLHCWRDERLNFFKACVAFLGDEFPRGEPRSEPYLVQHRTSCLAELGDEDGPGY